MLTSYCLNIYEVRTTITDEMHFWSRAIYDILMHTLCMWAFRLQSALLALILIYLSLQGLFKSLYQIADLRLHEYLKWIFSTHAHIILKDEEDIWHQKYFF